MWILFSILSATAVSVSDILRKRETLIEHNDVINLAVFLFALPFFVLVNLYLGIPFLAEEYWVILAAHILVDFFAFVLLMNAFRWGEVSLVAPFFSFTVLFVAILSPFFLGEHLSFMGYVGIALCILGAYLSNVLQASNGFFAPFRSIFRNKGIMAAIGTAFLWSIGAQLFKLGQESSSALFHPMMQVAGLSFLFALKVILQDRLVLISELRRDISGHIGLGVSFFIDILFMSLAFAGGFVAYALAIKRLSLILDVLMGKALLHENHYRQRLIAGSVVLLGVLIIVIWG